MRSLPFPRSNNNKESNYENKDVIHEKSCEDQSSKMSRIDISNDPNFILKQEAAPESLYSNLGNAEQFEKLINVIGQYLATPSNYNDEELSHKVTEIRKQSEADASFFDLKDLIQITLKGHASQLNKSRIKSDYCQFQLSEQNFDALVEMIRRAIISSRIIKKIALLKDIVSSIAELREFVEYTKMEIKESQESNLSWFIFEKIGQMYGVLEIMKITFENLMKSEIKHFYANRDKGILVKKYAVYVSYLLCPEFDCIVDMEGVHSHVYPVNRHGKKKSKCPLKIAQADFDIWLNCFKMAMDQLRHPNNVQEYILETLTELKYDICPMDDFKDRFAECFRSEIEKSANQKFDFGQIDEAMRLELIKYAEPDTSQSKDLEMRLQLIF